MSHRPFVPYPAKILRTKAVEVDAITDDIRALWDEMIEAM
ncbi:MAG: peptide deformylase, partial [Octadecabacter sp.]|nr:peptide deformylase [Octadecabacter sp.]